MSQEMGVANVAKTLKEDNRVTRYIRQTRDELRKVVWPTREAATNLTVVVLAVTVTMSAFLGLVDYIFSQAIGLLIR
ncbi:MAG: preprotein translocase subunit SecE [Chloroflexi bacterium]|nr:preprotein translocase subunit SecE [Chloroflexota bacterium]